jgi:hypothetical protein
MAEVEKIDAPEDIGSQRVEGVDHPDPSTINPMPSTLGSDSSGSKDTGNVGYGSALPSDDVDARDGSRRCPVGASVLEVSKDDAESQPPSTF